MGSKKKTSFKLMLVWIYCVLFGCFSISGGLFFIKQDYALGKRTAAHLQKKVDRFVARKANVPLSEEEEKEVKRLYQELNAEIVAFQEKKMNSVNPWAGIVSVLGVVIGIFYMGAGVRLFQRSRQVWTFLFCGIGCVVLENILKVFYLLSQRAEMLPLFDKIDQFAGFWMKDSEYVALSSLMRHFSSVRAIMPVVVIVGVYSLVVYILLPLFFISRKGIKSQLT